MEWTIQVYMSHPNLYHDVAGAMILKLKDKHRLTNAAIEEVIQLSDIVANHMVKETLNLVEQNGGMDTTTPFLKELPKIAANVTNPLSYLETTHKQLSFITTQLPYVVCP